RRGSRSSDGCRALLCSIHLIRRYAGTSRSNEHVLGGLLRLFQKPFRPFNIRRNYSLTLNWVE
ncbi:MAG: hypothetical protein ABF449_12280, partial [Ethanoligenens sp.]